MHHFFCNLLFQIISRFVVEDARITGFAYDPDHSRIFICLDIGNGVRLLKLSTAQGLDYWNGKTINTTVVAVCPPAKQLAYLFRTQSILL